MAVPGTPLLALFLSPTVLLLGMGAWSQPRGENLTAFVIGTSLFAFGGLLATVAMLAALALAARRIRIQVCAHGLLVGPCRKSRVIPFGTMDPGRFAGPELFPERRVHDPVRWGRA